MEYPTTLSFGEAKVLFTPETNNLALILNGTCIWTHSATLFRIALPLPSAGFVRVPGTPHLVAGPTCTRRSAGPLNWEDQPISINLPIAKLNLACSQAICRNFWHPQEIFTCRDEICVTDIPPHSCKLFQINEENSI
ncbi:MAG: hypothetical protein WC975_13940 [Phycisphaerae bacterium]